MQLVPQSHGLLDTDYVDGLIRAFPGVQFRLHANVRVERKNVIADLGNARAHPAWFAKAAAISRQLNAPCYTAHSGYRRDASVSEMLKNARRLADQGCRS